MSKLGLIILLLVSSKTVFVASQQWCSENDDCGANGCCKRGRCTTNCYCYSDWQCTGCCYEYKCHPKSSYHCSKSCDWNWECDSGCCKYGTCQESYECYSYSDTTTTATPRTSCYGNSQCYSGCCKNYMCQESYECDYPTTSSNTCNQCWGDQCCIDGYCQDCSPSPDTTAPDYDDYVDYGSSSSSRSGLSAGAYVGIAFAGVILVVLKLALWVSWCSRRERVVVVRRRITCVAVPIVNHDELQEEHERVMQPDRPPPAYSPRPFQDNIHSNGEPPSGPPPEYSLNPPANENEDTNSTEIAQNQRSGANGGVNSVPQDHIPPPAYSPSPAPNTDQNPTAGPAGQTQSAGVIGTTDETNSVPPGNTITSPVVSSSSPVGKLPQNNTGQNLTPMNPTQRENATSVNDESNADPWNNTIGPFVI